MRDWIVAALECSGIEYEGTDIVSTLERLALDETGGDPHFDNGEVKGLFTLMPETWEKFNVGGDIFDPVANCACAIAYLLHTYGGIVNPNDWLVCYGGR